MNRTKSFLKIWVFALSMLFVIALTLGITMAAYNTSRTADGTLSMGNGIIIDYSGFGKAQEGEWEKEQTTTFKLFANRDILPGDTINLNSAAIKKGTNSIDFYARIKFGYKFYDALDADITTTVGNEYTNFISTPTFASAWVNGNNNDGWFYYATGTTLNTLPASFVNIFSSSAINVELNVAGFNHEGGGYKFTDAGSNEITIAKVEATLTLETIQTTGSTWEIVPPALVQNESSQVIQINSNEITLGDVGGAYKLGTGEAGSLNTGSLTTLKIVVEGDSQINASAFDGLNLENVYIGNREYIEGISALSARIYTGETPTFTIGTNAFSGCSSLDIYLSSSINYQIYVSSLAGVNNVYYDGVLNNSLKSPSVGAVAGTTITVLSAPSVVTGGSETGSINNSSNSSKGAYTYKDAMENTWYFDLGTLNEENGTWAKDNTNGTQAQLRYYEKTNYYSNQAPVIPSKISSGEISNVPVVQLYSYNTTSLFDPDMRYYITTITIPNTIKSIGRNAFSQCEYLTSIIIPNSVVTNIGENAFYKCKKLATVELGNSVKGIGNYAFMDCKSLTSIELPNSVRSIGAQAFDGSVLRSISLSSSLTSISRGAFKNCGLLTSVIIPDSVTWIGGVNSGDYGAFYGCSSLQSVVLSNSLSYLADETFYGCSLVSFAGGSSKYQISSDGRLLFEVTGNSKKIIEVAKSGLTSIIIPSSVTSIKSKVFAGCATLTSFSGGNDKYQISADGRLLFEVTGNSKKIIEVAKSGLTSVTIPNSVTSIDENAFSSCTGLTSITIPSSVTSIGSSAFSGCTGLTTAVINGNITSIPSTCFSSCTNLTSVTLPVSVTSIGDYAFSGCSNLQSINWSASYDLGAEKNNEVVTLVKTTTGLTIGDINLPDATDLAAESVTAPTGKVFAGWTDGETTYTTTAPIAKVRAGLTAVWENE